MTERDGSWSEVTFIPLTRTDTLIECQRCGAVVSGDVTGQNLHDIWHQTFEDKIADARRWRPAPKIGGR